MTIVNMCCKHPTVGDDVHGYRDQTARRPDVTDSDDSDRLNSETCKYLSSLGCSGHLHTQHNSWRSIYRIFHFVQVSLDSQHASSFPLGPPFEPLVLSSCTDVACSNACGVFTSDITLGALFGFTEFHRLSSAVVGRAE